MKLNLGPNEVVECWSAIINFVGIQGVMIRWFIRWNLLPQGGHNLNGVGKVNANSVLERWALVRE